jgi:hypothetical protein
VACYLQINDLFILRLQFLLGWILSLSSGFDSAAPSDVFVSGSVEYHLDVAGLEAMEKGRLDCRNCGRASDDRGIVCMLELAARAWRNSVLGIIVGDVVACLWSVVKLVMRKCKINF